MTTQTPAQKNLAEFVAPIRLREMLRPDQTVYFIERRKTTKSRWVSLFAWGLDGQLEDITAWVGRAIGRRAENDPELALKLARTGHEAVDLLAELGRTMWTPAELAACGEKFAGTCGLLHPRFL